MATATSHRRLRRLDGPRDNRHDAGMRAWWVSAAVLSWAACGDNVFGTGEPLAPAGDLAILAHQDDDLLFMQPDLYDAVQRGGGVTSVYVTAGNSTGGLDAAEIRYKGLKSAYAVIAGAHLDDWTCGWIDLAGHAAEHCRLAAGNLSLVFLGYPDGGKDGENPDSLLHPWEARIDHATTVARKPATYDQSGLIAALAAVLDATLPTTLHTLEVASTHGREHSDHMVVGALAVLATAASAVDPAVIAYRGYNIDGEPANSDPTLFDRDVGALARYEACAARCAACGSACPIERIDVQHLAWLQRRYAVGMRRTAAGVLRIDDGCVGVTAAGANASIGDCATAPTWQLDEHGTLRASSGLCLAAILTGEIIAATCGNSGPGGRFFLDDDGHLWSGIVPAPQPDMSFAHLDCIAGSGGRPRAVLCGADRAPTIGVDP
jgi:LmbE family N-acetylglucosaminyl deacetylase